tara:strand:+ start:2298 stop:2906 length:609 start_codon:yes stop_codon:yes gene_type:complete
LLNFLLKVKDDEDNINVVVDSTNCTDKVNKVLDFFDKDIKIYRRPFDNFHVNAEFHTDNATGDYVFGIDADEMPQELLIKNIKNVIEKNDAEILTIPRMNIHPGITQEFIDRYNLKINELGWVNWPDYQSRIYKKCDHIKSTQELHTKIRGSDKNIAFPADPKFAIWHIKSMEKQLSRWKPSDEKDGTTFSAPSDNLYDILM